MTPAMLLGGRHLLLGMVPASRARRLNVQQPRVTSWFMIE
jgi:hypothetical protein